MSDSNRRAVVEVVGVKIDEEWLQEPNEGVIDDDGVEPHMISGSVLEDQDEAWDLIIQGADDLLSEGESDPFTYIDCSQAAGEIYQALPKGEDFLELIKGKIDPEEDLEMELEGIDVIVYVKANFVN